MGVNLSGLVESEQIELENLSGKKIAIDAYNTLYQFLSIIRDRFTGEPLRDSKGRITSHLSGLFYRTFKLLENSIEPVFVFDGEPPKFKEETVASRKKTREEAEIKWKEAVEKKDYEAVRRYSQQASRLTRDMVEESKKLLGFMGVPSVQAPSEAEAEAAYLVKKNMVWSAGSQDWDSILFGTPKLVRNLTITGRRKVPRKEKYIEVKPELVELDTVLSNLGITREQLIMVGILVGTDYNIGGIKGLGPAKALKLVQEKKTFDDVFSSVKWDFKTAARDIFEFFKNPPVEEATIQKQKFEPDKIREIMVQDHEFSDERIGSTIKKLEKTKGEKKQSKLEKFFG